MFEYLYLNYTILDVKKDSKILHKILVKLHKIRILMNIL